MSGVLVEGFAPDAIGLAAWLADRGEDVRLVGPGRASQAAVALRERGVAVEEGVDLDVDPGEPATAYLDVWTPEVAPRVARLRAAGTELTCLSDLLLARSPVPVVGVTGTAGKSTTSAFLASALRRAGLEVHEATGARPGQRWATEELLPLLDEAAPSGVLVLELTSSHLAFCRHPPHVALVTGVWPDHVELHGSTAAYLAAKRRIVEGQGTDDHVVVSLDDGGEAVRLVAGTPAHRWSFSAARPVERGAAVRGTGIVAIVEGREVVVGAAPTASGGRLQAALGAVAGALAVGVPVERLVGALDDLPDPPHRAHEIGRRGGVALVDDSAAATARKAAQTLAALGPETVVAVVGGERESAGLAVQISPAERALLEAALEVLARCHAVVAFGAAGALLAGELRRRGAPVEQAADADGAVGRALALADGSRGVRALVVAPMFPVPQPTREAIAAQLAAAADDRGQEVARTRE